MLLVARQKSREQQKKEVQMRLRIFKRDVPKAMDSLEIDKSRMLENQDHQ